MRRVLTLALAMALMPVLCAQTYQTTGATREDRVQMRVGAEFSKKWKNGLELSFDEDMRFDLYDVQSGTYAKTDKSTGKQLSADTTFGAAFDKSYTTLSLSYHPIEYFKMDGGYTLRILGKKGSDPAELLRHRLFFSVGAMYHFRYAKLYVRERFVCDMRADSVNLQEKNKFNWTLRSRIGSEFIVPGKPVKPYIWAELHNSLNAPTLQQKNGQQYITRVRTQVGCKWRLTKLSSMDFYYRFTYGYDRDINITKGQGYVQLTEETLYQHAIGVAYHLGW